MSSHRILEDEGNKNSHEARFKSKSSDKIKKKVKIHKMNGMGGY